MATARMLTALLAFCALVVVGRVGATGLGDQGIGAYNNFQGQLRSLFGSSEVVVTPEASLPWSWTVPWMVSP